MFRKKKVEPAQPKYPGTRAAVDGSTAVVEMETAASEAAGVHPIAPASEMGEGWAAAVAAGAKNVNGRRLLVFEPEGEHAAAAVTAGMSLVGMRAVNFSGGQGVAYMHESLYAAVAKRLTYVLNIAARAMTKQTLSVHAGHDDYHAVDDTGFIQVFAADAQEVADLNLIARKIAELSLNPAICAQDGLLTSHVVESVRLPEKELIKEYLGDPADLIESPTPAQRLVFGERRRRIPEMFDLDYPTMLGGVQNPDSYQQGVAAQRPFYFDHIPEIADQAFAEYATLTGRGYARASGYRLGDAEYVIVGQGSVVRTAELVCDHLRNTRKLKVGVLNVTMFRPFPADLITRLLRGKTAVAVLERVDQPLAVDPPLLREIRAAMTQAMENGRTRGVLPYPTLASCKPEEIPDFYSGCFGLGSRDLQPADLIAAVENMLEGGHRRRQYYLGIDFVRPDTRLPKLQIWQQQLLDGYPHLADLALPPAAESVDLLPPDSTSLRIHSVGGWGVGALGRSLASAAADLLSLHIKARPPYGAEKRGQPTVFQATLSHEPVRWSCEPKRVDVVLALDPNAFLHSNPLAGLSDGGVLVMQSASGDASSNGLPAAVQREIKKRGIRVFLLDALAIAAEEASDPNRRHGIQGAAFTAAFFRASGLLERAGLDEQKMLDRIAKLSGTADGTAVADSLRAMRRGFEEVRRLDSSALTDRAEEVGTLPAMPAVLDGSAVRPGIGNPGRFWEQVCHLYKSGDEGIADPFAAISAIPAATSTIRDMTSVRFKVPAFVAANCTGCGKCWTQCPDAAIPGVVNTIEQVLEAAMSFASNGDGLNRMRQVVPHLAREARKVMKERPFTTFADVLAVAYPTVVEKLNLDAERRAALDAESEPVFRALADFPLAKTQPFFDGPEAKKKGTGALLSITVNPEACKGCDLCVEVCPDAALVSVPQNDALVETLRHNWKLWHELPDTGDEYIDIAQAEEGVGVLPALLLKKKTYRSMFGGDSACSGCGEKTVLHLVLSAVNAAMMPRVEKYVKRLDDLIAQLDAKARGLLASEADLDRLVSPEKNALDVPLDPTKKETVERIAATLRELKDLRWRYTKGPGGTGRAACGITNATGCSSVWGGTYPYNPYPVPWVSHLFQDAPSVAIGIFEGHMRKMADGFVAVRRAELELADQYDPRVHEETFSNFDWRQFSDDEFALCPPILAVGGGGAMADTGFQNLSRLMTSGKPLRVVVLDTELYPNTMGPGCGSGFTGQISDMAGLGRFQQGKEETRKELALVAMAHRNVYVLQSCQAHPSHLLEGVLKGLRSRRPAVFVIHCPCPPEYGFADSAAFQNAKLALESRAFPILTYDPDGGPTLPERICLEGNPSLDDVWPTYDLQYVDEEGNKQTLSLPLTIADWAAAEGRFRPHFSAIAPDIAEDEVVPFADYLQLPPDEREEKRPFIHALQPDGRLGRLAVGAEIVALAEERLRYWSLLRQLAGLEIAPAVRAALNREFEAKARKLTAEYEAKMAQLRTEYPWMIARRLATGLLRAGNGNQTIADILAKADVSPEDVAGLDLTGGAAAAGLSAGGESGAVAEVEAVPAGAPAVAEAPVEEEEEEGLVMEPYIESPRCTTCDECTRLNGRMFAYNENKQAYIKDARAGTFADLVKAAEKCPVAIIHPGSPLNPDEKDLDKWIKRAERFN